MSQQPLWTTEALARAMGGRLTGQPAATVSDISIDTRTLVAGEAYVAIKGLAHDGHAFVQAALDKGAAVAVVSQDWAQAAPPGAYIVVADPLKALEKAGAVARARTAAKIVAVTGSIGKTSTKEALAHVLSREGRTHAPPKSFNNHIGVPLTLSRMPAASQFGVFEIGMNHAGEITPLSRLVKPDIAVITNVEAVHIENLGTIEAIADAKSEIFAGVEHGGAAVLPRDSRHFDQLARAARAAGIETIVTFGEHEEADVRLLRVVLAADCSTVFARVMQTDVTYKLGSPGRHLVMNSLAILAAAKLAGADLALAALTLGETRAVAGRGERSQRRLASGSFTLLDESYNANPVSVRAALAVLGTAPKGPEGRRLAVLGDMLELGPEAADLHAGLAEAVEKAGIDLVFCSGPLMEHLWKALPPHRRGAYAATSAELGALVIRALRAGDVAMVKGSRGSLMAPLVETLKQRFPPVPADEHQGAT
ncbi:MAG: UDP-N-acetylmuramoylalanyl-D-glutamyl-2,6-diaminopimelate--D-alanyl-D-alanine ligase [Phreatobacter sp.]|uniref:UDP-N-acetylmuramoylalanyl-D-glutamyl-2, 6-diaminopimelate--D-alanyl-D-alanine ligase n=1 Tax=Phreatobacter sp. TaxID=1966341 RepID=UPI0027364B42|nr:UDP-N-acetylmuramoylalanyl-D-glutamyl-2,6-diaminopimelate--D-alanyl-D-alanine ligase [Phreatobacter sp.]MDP2802939.1 UDP-N-acetylmuramoylalanyl-D-glutamyl-2,6-diaminopimelate--D-alanyl-D-alanine ligase [Phreatobacter sp.]